MIYNAAEKDGYFLQRGMLLALMTGQRLSDICKMQFSDIRDGYLHVEQQKTGTRIAIPLALRCDKLNLTRMMWCHPAAIAFLVRGYCTTITRKGQLSAAGWLSQQH